MKAFNLFMYHFFSVLWKVKTVILGLLVLIILGGWIGIIFTGLNVAAAVRAVKEVYTISMEVEDGSPEKE